MLLYTESLGIEAVPFTTFRIRFRILFLRSNFVKLIIKFYADYFLSKSELKKACEVFNVSEAVSDNYLNNFKIYCLILEEKKEQAQLLFDLSKELGEIDTFFENKFNIMMGYEAKDEIISDENILYFHLSHKQTKNLIMSQK